MGRNRVGPSVRLLTRCQPGRPERPPERPWETTLRQTIEIARRCGARDPDDTGDVAGLPAGNQDQKDGSVRILPLRTSGEPAGPVGPKAPAQPPAPAVPLIDREREVGELHAALGAALGGSGRVVLLSGEPGIGKTRLASALADEAESRGVPVWWGRGWEDGPAPAFWSWNTALRRWMDQVGDAAVAAAVGSWGADLALVFPVLRDWMPELPPSESGKSDGARFRLFDIASRFLGALARPAGLVVVLDDIHWADGPSLKLLEFIAADLADMRLLVVATYRDTEVRREDPFSATLSRL